MSNYFFNHTDEIHDSYLDLVRLAHRRQRHYHGPTYGQGRNGQTISRCKCLLLLPSHCKPQNYSGSCDAFCRAFLLDPTRQSTYLVLNTVGGVQ
jgi:hypothetical protein